MHTLRTQSLSLIVALCVLAAGLLATPALAQDNEGFPTIDFGVKLMQGAQYMRTNDAGLPSDDAEVGFQRVRANLEVNAQFHERISAFVDFGNEPGDFGNGGGSFGPAVDLVFLDLMLSDALTLRLGSPVTSLFNFRGYSDGAAVQSNPLIGNSPIDFITAETGVQLLGSAGNANFDLTVTSPTFFESFAPGTGFTIVAKGSIQASEMLSLGAGISQATSRIGTPDGEMNLIFGDGENYSLSGLNGVDAQGNPNAPPQPNRYTHARLLPGFNSTLLQLDARAMGGPMTFDVWGGYGLEGDTFRNGDIDPRDSSMWWAGVTAKFDATDNVFLAARGSYTANSSDWASDLDETALYRVQAGLGFTFWDAGMLKLEFVTQDEGVNSPGQIGTNWYGGLAELSVAL